MKMMYDTDLSGEKTKKALKLGRNRAFNQFIYLIYERGRKLCATVRGLSSQ